MVTVKNRQTTCNILLKIPANPQFWVYTTPKQWLSWQNPFAVWSDFFFFTILLVLSILAIVT